MLAEADSIREEDIKTNKLMSRIGAAVVPQKATILTHCNTGALATAGWGTALGVIKTAFYDKKDIFVYADETRPRFQGARLTAWELMEAKIPRSSSQIVQQRRLSEMEDRPGSPWRGSGRC